MTDEVQNMVKVQRSSTVERSFVKYQDSREKVSMEIRDRPGQLLASKHSSGV